MAALPLNKALHFVFYYQLHISFDFCCALHPKNCFYHFQGLFVIIKRFFSKFQDNPWTNTFFLELQEFYMTKVIFQDFSRSMQTLCNTKSNQTTHAQHDNSSCIFVKTNKSIYLQTKKSDLLTSLTLITFTYPFVVD